MAQWKPDEAKLLGREPVEREDLPAEWQDFSDEELRDLCWELALEGHSFYAGYPESAVGFDFDKSLDLLSKALYIARSLHDQKLAKPSLYGISASLRGQGEMERAIEYSRIAVSEIRDDDYWAIAEAAKLYGLNLLTVGDYTGALENFQKSYEAYVHTSQMGGQINALAEIADVYYYLGLEEQAFQYFTEVERLADEFENWPFHGLALGRLGKIRSQRREYKQAAECFHQAIKVLEGVPPRYYGIVCEVMLARGDLFVLTGNDAEVRGTYGAALEYAKQGQQSQHRARCLLKLAEVDAAEGNLETALVGFSEAISAAEASYDFSTAAGALAARAALHRARGDSLPAESDLKEAYDICRDQAARFQWETGLGSGLVENLYVIGAELASLEVELGKPEDAFDALQAAKSTPLLRLLAQARQHAASPGLQVKLNSFRAINAGIQELRMELSWLPAEDKNASGAGIGSERDTRTNLMSRIQEQSSKAAEIWEDIRAGEPRLASVIETRTISPAEAQRKVLRKGQVLIEYALAPHNIIIFTLPQRGKMKVAIVPLEGLKTSFEEWICRQVTMLYDPRQAKQTEAGRALFDLLLAPISQTLPEDSHLIVCPDGALFNVPFDALVDRQGVLLLNKHTISYSSSATMLSYAGTERTNRNALVAGVSFCETKLSGENQANVSEEPTSALFTRSLLTPLPGVHRELNEVAKVLGVTPAVDAVVTESWLKYSLRGKRVVHLATHGRLSPTPLLNGLYAYQPEGSEGVSGQHENAITDDGFLSMCEVMGIPMEGCELIVLSCCHSFEGDVSTGQGMMGISQGFLYAGVSTIIASLAQVNDDATRELMVEFYKSWWESGLSKSEALRAAKQSLANSERFSDPRFWAPFVLYGLE